MRRALLVLLLLAGCSSESDLAAGPLSCMFAWSGDASGTNDCHQRFCRQPNSDSLLLQGITPNGPEAELGLDGPFTLNQSYSGADLSTFNVGYRPLSQTSSYVAGSSVPGTTVTITITDVELNTDPQCGPNGNGTAHGTAHMGLVEDVNDDAGARPPGHVMLDAVF